MENFSFNLKWHRILKRFSDNIRHNVMDALMEYMESGKTPELKTAEAIAFEFIKTEIEDTAQNPLPVPQPDSSELPEPKEQITTHSSEPLQNFDEIIANVPVLKDYFSNREENHCAAYNERTFRLATDLHKEIAVKAAHELSVKEGIPMEQCKNLVTFDSEILNICYTIFDALRPGFQYGNGAIITKEEYVRFIESQKQNGDSAGSSKPENSSADNRQGIAVNTGQCPDSKEEYNTEKYADLIRIVPALRTYFSGEDPNCCASIHSDILRLEPELHRELAVKVMFERAKKDKTPIREYANHMILAADLYDLCSPALDALRPDHQYEYSAPITRHEWMTYMEDKKKLSQHSGVT